MGHLIRGFRVWSIVLAGVFMAAACSSGDNASGAATARASSTRTLYIAGIPDQDFAVLETRFGKLAEYLSQETGLNVKYLPSIDYAAVVTGFRQGDIQLAWYGGLTGVQARLAAPGAQAIAQRQADQEFHSVFIARKALGITSLEDLKGRTFTFGSESSTSGNLMPRAFLSQAGIDPGKDFAAVNYSGSHDATWKLVEAGTFEAGALNAVVWQRRVDDGSVDTSKVEAFFTTPSYYDYHWVVSGDLDRDFGAGTTQKIREALLSLNVADGGIEQEIMEAFSSAGFISTTNENYTAIEQVARDLGIIEN